MADSEESSKREFFACKSSSLFLLSQFTSFTVVFNLGEGNPMKVWLLIGEGNDKFNFS